uniref:Secreted protein n=1 Tax=Amblyomma triste TaxID=251400 RepID=A0A023GDB0_AMBTT
MIFILALCFCAIASAAATQLEPIDITPMVDVSQRLAVIKRTYNTGTPFRCHSALRLEELPGNKYKYNLKARKTTFIGYEFSSGNVEISLENIPGKEVKRSTYTASYTKTTLTLVHKSEGNDCFVVNVEKNSTLAGCELIVPASHVTKVNTECENFFTTNCRGTPVQLYEVDCTYN